jgi:hypothetical protein
MPLIHLILACSLLGLSPSGLAPSQHKQPSPPSRYEDFGACPFECCTYRRWSVSAETLLYKSRSANSPVAFRVRKGEHVVGLTGVVITLKPGKALVKKATTLGLIGERQVRVKAGDILYLLHYEGEGVYKFWFRGRIYEAQMPFAPDLIKSTDDPAQAYLQQLSEPETVWWVKVKNRRGQVGWSKQDDHFGDMDSCA